MVDALLPEHTVAVLDDLSTGRVDNLAEAGRQGLTDVVEVDVCSREASAFVTRWQPDVIVHLAAQVSVSASVAHAAHDLHVNTHGTINIATTATLLSRPCKIVFAGTCAIYGAVEPSRLPIAEDQPVSPINPYGISKAAALHYLRFFHDHGRLRFTALILANVYGPRQRAGADGAVVASFCSALSDQEPVVIHGDGRQTRDFVYVVDVADAFRRACVQGDADMVNIASGQAAVSDIYRYLRQQMDDRVSACWILPRPSDMRRSVLAVERAREKLGWSPSTPLDEGLRATFAEFARDRVRPPRPHPKIARSYPRVTSL